VAYGMNKNCLLVDLTNILKPIAKKCQKGKKKVPRIFLYLRSVTQKISFIITAYQYSVMFTRDMKAQSF
jgi:hypothetical protein